MITPSTRNAW